MAAIIPHLNRLDVVAFAFCGLLLGILRFYYKQKRNSKFPLPPGPKPLPLIGNTLDMPLKDDRLIITQWGKQYGDVVLVTLLGGSRLIYLNSAKAVIDLFEKRSRIYSDRPEYPLIAKSVGTDWNFAFLSYGESWKSHRKTFVSKFGIRKAVDYLELQEILTKQVLRRLLRTPEKFLDHLQLHAAQLIMKVVYGIDLESVNDKYIRNIRAVLEVLSEASRPIAYLVESIPIVKHVNYFWPGVLGAKSIAQMRNDIQIMMNTPFSFVKARMAQGVCEPSYVSDLLEHHEAECLDEGLIRRSAAVAYGAGAETSAASTSSFILAMVGYPEVQEKAQAEIDRVVGGNRLPTFSDKDSLPYVFAIYKETLRWHTVVPQGVPRLLQTDDIYDGYLLPAGSTIVSNTWGILHDPSLYPEPMVFKPERYFSSDGTLDLSSNDPEKYAFGYGRRICAGRHFAENSLWLFIAQTLATMKVTSKLDAQGRKIDARLEPTPGLVSLPAPFHCSIVPRSEQAVGLIMKD